MGSKEDWEELEKWQKEYNNRKIEQYGANLDKPIFKKVRKKSIAIAKVLDKLLWAICYLLVGALIVGIIGVVCYTFIIWSEMAK